MIVTSVHVEVKPEYIQDFIVETSKNHVNSIQETGNLRFDVLQDVENPCKFVLYEAYIDEDSSAKHKQTTHYKIWREAVEKMMAKPRNGIKYRVICPTDMKRW
jgi:autoinducer 2-degrading protein